ncbi:MAG: tetratricopeptide repeat protein [Verrucomicrobiota bacterium]
MTNKTTGKVDRTTRTAPRGLTALAAVVVVVVASLAYVGGTARADTDRRELQARESFAAGRYQQALDIFVKLYAEKVHPNYLRNIGRCYQNLGDADKAISSFREYLRQAKAVRPDERAEVEAYIKEMEDLKRQRAAENATVTGPATATPTTATTATAPPSPAAAPPPPTLGHATQPTSLSVAPDPGAGSQASQSQTVTLVDAPGNAASNDSSNPVYTRWWFWTLIGVAVVGGVAVAAASGAFTKTEDAPCVGTCQ